jgi:hypothetical protein
LSPSDWYSLARCVRDGRRADLGRIAAVAALQDADAGAWHALLTQKDPMSVVAFSAIAIGHTERGIALIEGLLKSHWTSEWLATAHSNTRTQGLAASMLALYESNLPKTFVDALAGEGLRLRVERELERIDTLAGHELERVVALYGSAALLLPDLAPPKAMPPIKVFLDMLDNLRLPEPPHLPYRVAATWLGVKQVVESRLLLFPMPPVTQKVFELWRDAVPPGEGHVVVREAMVAWLRDQIHLDQPAAELFRRAGELRQTGG